ncbi:transcription factor mef2A-like [Culicoides brevitarsis]|uniref:transcription factor mef2A-like n=1 Tax=Culicoides brevitarsis TaxID=469753 RepID=UPI00307B675D
MASMKKESLEERLERIRKKNEEIEKKHQETERDKLLAKVQGALVDCKASDDDWPKGHKYDKLDFTYDVPADKLEAEKAAKLELQQRREQSKQPTNSRGSRFTDIPQDPKSFLADEERGDKPKPQQPSQEKPPKQERKQNGEKRGSFEKKPQTPPHPSSHQATGNYQQTSPLQQQQQPQQGGRQIVGRHKKSPKSPQMHEMSDVPLSPSQQFAPDVFAQDFSNLTVSVSKDGDYKSVRLSQTPMIGSGRVGPRQITKTQFQGIEPEMEHFGGRAANPEIHRGGNQHNKPSSGGDRRPFNKEKRNGNNNNFNRHQPQKSSPQSNNSQNNHHPQVAAPNAAAPQSTVKQFSVQDRLKRAQASVGNNNSKNVILNIVATNDDVERN